MGGAEGTRTPDPHTASRLFDYAETFADIQIAYGVRDSGRISNSTNARERSERLPRWLPDDLAQSRTRTRAAHQASSSSRLRRPSLRSWSCQFPAYRGAMVSICSMTNLIAAGCLSGGYLYFTSRRLIDDRSLA